MEEWITVQEAAKVRQCSDRHILRLIQKEELQAKREGHRWLVLKSSLGEVSEPSPPESDLMSLLKVQLQEKDELIKSLRQQTEDMSERHDTIVLQLTRQLENQQKLLEYHQEPWYRRWFRKQAT
jgi:excisionase family DNA binding protein